MTDTHKDAGQNKYPAEIVLAKYADISDEEIAQDIRDTEREIANYALQKQAEETIAATSEHPHERKMAAFKASARPGMMRERQDFVDFLRRIQAARSAFVVAES